MKGILLLGVIFLVCLPEALTFDFLCYGFWKIFGLCKVTVTYEVRNRIKEPVFEYSIKVKLTEGEPFIRFMEKAADIDTQKRFNFSASYYSGIGYFINTINHITANYTDDKTWWQFLLAPDIVLSKGVKLYIPEDGDHIIMNITQS